MALGGGKDGIRKSIITTPNITACRPNKSGRESLPHTKKHPQKEKQAGEFPIPSFDIYLLFKRVFPHFSALKGGTPLQTHCSLLFRDSQMTPTFEPKLPPDTGLSQQLHLVAQEDALCSWKRSSLQAAEPSWGTEMSSICCSGHSCSWPSWEREDVQGVWLEMSSELLINVFNHLWNI